MARYLSLSAAGSTPDGPELNQNCAHGENSINPNSLMSPRPWGPSPRGPRPMGTMANGDHGQWGPRPMGTPAHGDPARGAGAAALCAWAAFLQPSLLKVFSFDYGYFSFFLRFFPFIFEDTKCSCLHARYHWKSNNERIKKVCCFISFPPHRLVVCGLFFCSKSIHIAACRFFPCLHTQVDPLHNTHDQCTMGTRHFTLMS